MFGLYSDIPSLYRITFLCSFFGFIFFFYLLSNYLITPKLKWLKFGITIFVSGIFGNVVDRVIYGQAIDFIPISFFSNTIIFNIADFFQWVGAGVILHRIFKKEKIIWFQDSLRKKMLINPKEQLMFASKFAAIAFTTSFLLGLFSYTYFKATLGQSNLIYQKQLLITFTLSYLSIAMIFTTIVFIAGIYISHKTAGPLYAFERHVESLLVGKEHKLILKEGDNYKHLMHVANKLDKHFKSEKKVS